MPDDQRNVLLALKMEWRKSRPVDSWWGWRSPDGKVFLNLPDFRGDDCTAVRYLLSWLRELDPAGVTIDFYPDEVSVRCFARRVYEPTLSLALAAAVDAMEVPSEQKS